MSLKIVLVTHYYPAHGGGVERVAEQLARRIGEANGASIVWCASDADLPPDQVTFRCEPMTSLNVVERMTGLPYPLWTAPSLLRLARLIREADAVHVHDGIYVGSLAAAALAKRYGKRLVVTQHIGIVPLRASLRWALALVNRIAARFVLGRADAVAFISPAVQQYFSSLIGNLASFHYVSNGVDVDMFHPATEPTAELRKRLGFDPDRPLLLFVGRFVPKKRLHIVRDMAAARPDWQWCVIGQGAERPEHWQLPNVSVRAPMPQNELVDYYRAADLFVLPSEGEGFPLVVQEAMACGLPACITAPVATGSTVPPELVINLPDAGPKTARLGVTAIEEWLSQPKAIRSTTRDACAVFAACTWNWRAAAQFHAHWLRGGAA